MEPLPPAEKHSYRRLVLIFAAAYAVLIVGAIVLLAAHHNKPKTIWTGPSVPVYTGIQQKARNSKRQADIQSLQTQLEAFFSQDGYYPSLTDLNSSTWRAANIPTLDQYSLADPISACDPTATGCLVAVPAADAYAYAVTDSNGQSCEKTDTDCVKYTLTATYEGTVNGTGTYVKSNLD